MKEHTLTFQDVEENTPAEALAWLRERPLILLSMSSCPKHGTVVIIASRHRNEEQTYERLGCVITQLVGETEQYVDAVSVELPEAIRDFHAKQDEKRN